MDLAQIQSDLAKGGLLIDVRSPEEYAEGHVKGARLIPHTQFFSADIPAEVRHSYGLTDDLLRLSIGIEDSRDLVADLRAALED